MKAIVEIVEDETIEHNAMVITYVVTAAIVVVGGLLFCSAFTPILYEMNNIGVGIVVMVSCCVGAWLLMSKGISTFVAIKTGLECELLACIQKMLKHQKNPRKEKILPEILPAMQKVLGT